MNARASPPAPGRDDQEMVDEEAVGAEHHPREQRGLGLVPGKDFLELGQDPQGHDDAHDAEEARPRRADRR